MSLKELMEKCPVCGYVRVVGVDSHETYALDYGSFEKNWKGLNEDILEKEVCYIEPHVGTSPLSGSFSTSTIYVRG